MNRRASPALSFVLLLTSFAMSIIFTVQAQHVQAGEKEGDLNVEIEINERYIKEVLVNKVGALFASQLVSEEDYCKAAAVLVAQEATNNYGYWNTFIDLGKVFAKGIETAGKLTGSDNLTKAGQLAFTIAEALEDEEPAAALGRAVVTEASDWLVDKIPKTGSKTADDVIKDQSEKAKKQLVEALFPGEKKKAKSYKTTVGDCTVEVTPEIQWPTGENRQALGGLWLYISGDCRCKKPLSLNSNYFIPTNFRGQLQEIKNCELGRFHLEAFLPMERLETSVSYAGEAINLKDFAKKATNLKQAIDDALKGNKSDKSPKELTKDLQKLTKKATKVSPTLILRPVYKNSLDLKDLYAKCKDCPKESEAPVMAQPPPPAQAAKTPTEVANDICEKECKDRKIEWMKVADKAIKAKDPNGTDMKALKELEGEIKTAKYELATAQNNLKEAKETLAKRDDLVKVYQDAASSKGYKDPGEVFGQKWNNVLKGQSNAKYEVVRWTSKVEGLSEKLAKKEKEAEGIRKDVLKGDKAADAARAAYDECLRDCWNKAKKLDPRVQVPEEVMQWDKEHPKRSTTPGTTTSSTTGTIDECVGSSSSTTTTQQRISLSEAISRIKCYIAHIEKRKKYMAGAYYDAGAVKTLKDAFKEKAVNTSVTYADSWGKMGIGLTWSESATKFYDYHLDVLNQSLNAIRQRDYVAGSEMASIDNGMRSWDTSDRDLEAQFKALVNAYTEEAKVNDEKDDAYTKYAVEYSKAVSVRPFDANAVDAINARYAQTTRPLDEKTKQIAQRETEIKANIAKVGGQTVFSALK